MAQANLCNTRKRVLVIAVAVSLGGCASSPFVDLPRVKTAAAKEAQAKEGPIITLNAALLQADDTYEAFRKKLVEDAGQRDNLNRGLIGLVAAAIGFSVFDAHSDALKATALVGGTAYTLGNWNYRDRNSIYLEGMKGITCAKAAITPLTSAVDQKSNLETRSKDLETQIKTVSTAVEAVTTNIAAVGILRGNKQIPLLDKAQADLDEIDAVLAQANDLLSQTANIQAKADTAGTLLSGKVQEIGNQVYGTIDGTLAKQMDIPKLINDLVNAASLFAPGVSFSVGTPGKINTVQAAAGETLIDTAQSGAAPGMAAPAGEMITLASAQHRLATSLGKLHASRIGLLGSISRLKGLLETFELTNVQNSLKGCGVDVAKATNNMALDHNLVELVVGEPATELVTITGGTSPYSAGLVRTPVPGLSVGLVPASNVVRIEATKDTTAGTYVANVGDATQRIVAVTIRVSAKEAVQAAQAEVKPECDVEGWNKQLDKEEICLFQKQLGVTVTQQFDAATCKALKDRIGTGFKPTVEIEYQKLVRKWAGLDDTKVGTDIPVIAKSGKGCSPAGGGS